MNGSTEVKNLSLSALRSRLAEQNESAAALREVQESLLGQTSTKLCIKCRQTKSSSDFNKNRNTVDGLQWWCRDCVRDYRRLWAKTERGRSCKSAYAKSPAGAEAARRYYKTDKGKATAKRTRINNRHKVAARGSVRYHIITGKLKVPDYCPRCGEKKRLDAHHHKGYGKENKLDVVFLCRQCHAKEHHNK